jgi:hypothetical protein
MNADKRRGKQLLVLLAAFGIAMITSNLTAETLHVDGRTGNDANPGTEDQPLQTIGRAAAIVNSRTEPGPTTIKIAPGIYSLTECVTFENKRGYTENERLVIEAVTLPDDPQWKPALMPVILSTEDPRKPAELDNLTATYSITIKVSHVTIRGLKFLGNPLQRNWHCCISRIGEDLDDLVVTQCMFVGDRDALDIYCAALATGNRFVVDHCIFANCHGCVVFWDGPGGIPGEACAMRHCIVDGAYISGVWTCQTAEDLEFHHNIVTRSEYFWMRKAGDGQKYRLHDCIVANNKYYSGYGAESGPTGQTGPEVTYEEENVIRSGEVVLEKDKRARDYLHVAKGSLGSNLGAGLFIRTPSK